jgi:hypothetical protein
MVKDGDAGRGLFSAGEGTGGGIAKRRLEKGIGQQTCWPFLFFAALR